MDFVTSGAEQTVASSTHANSGWCRGWREVERSSDKGVSQNQISAEDCLEGPEKLGGQRSDGLEMAAGGGEFDFVGRAATSASARSDKLDADFESEGGAYCGPEEWHSALHSSDRGDALTEEGCKQHHERIGKVHCEKVRLKAGADVVAVQRNALDGCCGSLEGFLCGMKPMRETWRYHSKHAYTPTDLRAGKSIMR